jgi:hypothetical protein
MGKKILNCVSSILLCSLVCIPLHSVPLGGAEDTELEARAGYPLRVVACPRDGSFKVVGQYLTVEINLEKEDKGVPAARCRQKGTTLYTKVARKLSRKLCDVLSVPIQYLSRAKTVLQVMGRLAIRIIRFIFD